jgi:hypothetical protein
MRWLLLAVLACGNREPPPRSPPGPSVGGAAVPRDAAAVVETLADAAPATVLAPRADVDRPPPQLAVLHRGRGVDVVESINDAEHAHGGAPAKVYEIRINFEVHDRRAHSVSINKLEWLHGYCNDDKKWADRKPLAVTGYRLYGWDDDDPLDAGKQRVALPAKPGRYQVVAGFHGFEAYQACDRFAFAMTLELDGSRFPLELPLEVTRIEPLRKDPFSDP